MVFGVILAGGIGSRMGNVEKPKQYLSVGGKPIILHTLEKFYVNSKFEKLIVLCPSQWINHTKNLVKKNFNDSSKIVVIEGGSTRNETIMNSIRYIEKEYGLDDDTIIVTHDSVRPFLTYRIIEDNIRYAQEYGACDTVIPASDTIVESAGHEIISNIPDRSIMYQGQTPQSFKAKKLKELYEGLTEEEKEILTDACKIFVIKGEQVQLVKVCGLVLVQVERASAVPLVQPVEHLACHVQLRLRGLVALGLLLEARDGLLHRGYVGQDQLGLDGLHVGERVHAAGHVHHVRVAEEAHHFADGVRLADVRKELVAQTLALAGAGDQAGDVDELHRCRHDARRVVNGGQGVQPRVGHGDHAHVGLDGGERVVGREAALVREGREQRGLADVGQAHDTDGKRHAETS